MRLQHEDLRSSLVGPRSRLDRSRHLSSSKSSSRHHQHRRRFGPRSKLRIDHAIRCGDSVFDMRPCDAFCMIGFDIEDLKIFILQKRRHMGRWTSLRLGQCPFQATTSCTDSGPESIDHLNVLWQIIEDELTSFNRDKVTPAPRNLHRCSCENLRRASRI